MYVRNHRCQLAPYEQRQKVFYVQFRIGRLSCRRPTAVVFWVCSMPCTPHSPYCCCCQQQGAIGNTAGLGEREGGWHIACCVLRPKMQLQQQQQHITSNFPEKRDPPRKLYTTYYWPLPNLGYRFIPLFFPLKYWEMTRNAQTLRESGSVCVCMLPWYLPPFPLFSVLCFVRLPHHPPPLKVETVASPSPHSAHRALP